MVCVLWMMIYAPQGLIAWKEWVSWLHGCRLIWADTSPWPGLLPLRPPLTGIFCCSGGIDSSPMKTSLPWSFGTLGCQSSCFARCGAGSVCTRRMQPEITTNKTNLTPIALLMFIPFFWHLFIFMARLRFLQCKYLIYGLEVKVTSTIYLNCRLKTLRL